jgi:hypothetical protein
MIHQGHGENKNGTCTSIVYDPFTTWSSADLCEIRVFLALADELHFGRAADTLGVTTSYASQMLRRLEACSMTSTSGVMRRCSASMAINHWT